MKVLPKSLLLASLLLAAALPCPSIFAQATDAAASPSASPAVEKETKFPFKGKIESIDLTAGTFTLNGTTKRVIAVTADTKITKNGEAATLKDATVGDEVAGRTKRSADGKLTALSVRFGPRPTAKAQPSASPTAS